MELNLYFIRISGGLKNPSIAVKTENDIPRRCDTNGDSKGVEEHYMDVKLDKVGELQSKCEDDQKWKSNSLTKTKPGQPTNNFSGNHVQRNIAQRACSSEQSSPHLERRNNQITPLNYINGESNIYSGAPNNTNDKNTSSNVTNNVSEFAQVSEDMNELVYHLNSIQNDISELAGKNISICENKT